MDLSKEVRQALVAPAIVENPRDGWSDEMYIVNHLYKRGIPQSPEMMAVFLKKVVKDHRGKPRILTPDTITEVCKVLCGHHVLSYEPTMTTPMYRLHSDFRQLCGERRG